MQKNLDAKHDKILKSLLRLPDNRRCAVCDTLVRTLKCEIRTVARSAVSAHEHLMRDHADRRDRNMWSWTSQCLCARSAAASSKSFRPSRMQSIPMIPANDAKHEHIAWTPQKRLFGNCSRQFNHRCKGISMASFKPEEIRGLENGGNGVSACDWTY